MKILSRYVFREILASSFLATTLATFVIFLRGISPLVELLVRSGNGFIFLELCVLALPPVLLLSIPFGVLVGILVGLGRMSSDNEMIAMRSGGVSSRVVAPPVSGFRQPRHAGFGRLRGLAEPAGDPRAIQAPQQNGRHAGDRRRACRRFSRNSSPTTTRCSMWMT